MAFVMSDAEVEAHGHGGSDPHQSLGLLNTGAARATGDVVEKAVHPVLHAGQNLVANGVSAAKAAIRAQVVDAAATEATHLAGHAAGHAAAKGLSAVPVIGGLLAGAAEYGVARATGESPVEAAVGATASVVAGTAVSMAGGTLLAAAATGIVATEAAKGVYSLASGETRHEHLEQIASGTIPATEFAAQLQDPKSAIRQTVTEKLGAEFDAKNADMVQTFGGKENYDKAMASEKAAFIKQRTAQLITENAPQPDMPNSYGLTAEEVKGGYTSPGIASAQKELTAHAEHAGPSHETAHAAPEAGHGEPAHSAPAHAEPAAAEHPQAAPESPAKDAAAHGMPAHVLAAAKACGLNHAGVSCNTPGLNQTNAPNAQRSGVSAHL